MSKSTYVKGENQTTKMLIPESVMWLLKIITPPLWFYIWITNLDNAKSIIIFIVSLIIGILVSYQKIIGMIRRNRRIEIDNEMKELEIQEKKLSMKEKEVEMLERELRARITGIPKK